MGWDDAPPSTQELQSAVPAAQSWDAAPPSPQELGKSGNEFLDQHPTLNKMVKGALGDLPLVGGVAGGIVGGAAGTAIAPGAGTVGLGMAGAATGAAAGSGLKDTLSHFIYGEDKDLIDSLKDAGIEGGLAAAGEGAGAAVVKGGSALAKSGVGKAVLEGVKDVGAKIGEIATGVPDKVIKAYAGAADTIQALYSANGGNVARMADAAKTQFQQDITQTRQMLGEQIGKALEAAGPKKSVDVTPLIQRIETYRKSIDPKLKPEALAEVDQLLSRIKGKVPLAAPTEEVGYVADTMGKITRSGPPEPPVLGPNGKPMKGMSNVRPVINDAEDRIVTLPVGGKGETRYMTSPSDLNDIVRFLRDQADAAYNPTAMGFQVSKDAAQIAKASAGLGKDILHEAVPGITKANEQLSKLHRIEAKMNKNLLIPGKPEAGLIDAGTGASPRNAAALEDIGKITGTDMTTPTTQVAAAKQFGKVSFTKGNRMASGLKIGIDTANTLGNAVSRASDIGGVGALTGQTLGSSVVRGSQGVRAIQENNP